jgi:hypothetical protein
VTVELLEDTVRAKEGRADEGQVLLSRTIAVQPRPVGAMRLLTYALYPIWKRLPISHGWCAIERQAKTILSGAAGKTTLDAGDSCRRRRERACCSAVLSECYTAALARCVVVKSSPTMNDGFTVHMV